MRKLFQMHSGKGDNVVNIDGREFRGRDVVINDQGKVYVDGVEQSGSLVGPVSVVITGDVDSVETGSGNVSVEGRVGGSVRTGSGDVSTDYVSGNVQTGSGDVIVNGVVEGSVRTGSGDITHRRR